MPKRRLTHIKGDLSHLSTCRLPTVRQDRQEKWWAGKKKG